MISHIDKRKMSGKNKQGMLAIMTKDQREGNMGNFSISEFCFLSSVFFDECYEF